MLRRVAHAPEGKSTTLEPDISASKRLVQLLDYDKKGFISEDNIYNTCFAVGLDLSVSDMRAITDVEPKGRAEAFMKVLSDYRLSIDEVEELVDFFVRTRRQRRPDKFVYMKRREFFVKRFLALYIPGLAFRLSHFFPRLTPYEEGTYAIMQNVLGVFDQIVIFLTYLCLVLLFTGISSISVWNVTAIIVLNIPIGWGPQSSREAYSWSEEGTVRRHVWQRKLTVLRYTEIHLKDGSIIDGMASLTRMFRACNTLDELTLISQLTPLSFMNQKKQATSGRRRSSVADDFTGLTQDMGKKQRDQMDDKFNIMIFGWNKLGPFLKALLLTSIPTVVRRLKGESTIFDDTHSGTDVAVDIMMSIFILLTAFFVTLVILKDARTEISSGRKWVEYLLGSIQPEDEPLGKGMLSEESFMFRLDSTEAIKGFASFYRFTSSYVNFNNNYHVSSFESLGVICIASVILLFVGSVLDFEVDVWNVYLMATALEIWPVVLTGLFNIVKVDELLTKRLTQYLRHQRRMNENILREDFTVKQLSPEDSSRLVRACGSLNALIEEIEDTHKNILLLGKLGLNKGNMVKLTGAMAAGIFTTIMRSAINLD
mmetsp:Transcript_1566/g.2759  ORF Transcript_1566/g.2759 Transcript_1566/m.2759 type:complete len:597 (+) Transcript_1566:198-1988(+)